MRNSLYMHSIRETEYWQRSAILLYVVFAELSLRKMKIPVRGKYNPYSHVSVEYSKHFSNILQNISVITCVWVCGMHVKIFRFIYSKYVNRIVSYRHTGNKFFNKVQMLSFLNSKYIFHIRLRNVSHYHSFVCFIFLRNG